MNNNPSFLGTGWNFPPSFDRATVSVDMLAGVADVEASINIILSTMLGERIMLPTFGCNLQPYVFEVMNPPTVAMIQKIVQDALSNNEPRIIVSSVVATPDEVNGILNINIQYSIITTNTRTNYVYPFYFKEATNLNTSQ